MRELLVFGEKNFKISIPDDAKVTFGPWSPPNAKGTNYQSTGTLRVYQGTKDNILGCWGGVTGFRDSKMQYIEEVLVEKGSTIWQNDKGGYVRESKVQATRGWNNPQLPEVVTPAEFLKKKKKGAR